MNFSVHVEGGHHKSEGGELASVVSPCLSSPTVRELGKRRLTTSQCKQIIVRAEIF